ncbi:hypothetical protein Q5P01_000700 [Channa striata]|uniref:Uncharacterized protein n=1 Tax=Channa striata TaxID=64152 RepID=A0AA88LMC0_CHASR|nr:hypothetical protein Q5P01_000700 [Channa striata]
MDLVLLPLLTMLAAGVAFGENPQELDLTAPRINCTAVRAARPSPGERGVRDGPVRGAVHDTVDHCQHGKPCAIPCPSDKDEGASLWPGLVPEDELWWGEEWKDVQIKGESPTMISPGVMIADRLRNRPSRVQEAVPRDRRGKRRHRDTRRSVLEGPRRRSGWRSLDLTPPGPARVQTPVQVHGDPRGWASARRSSARASVGPVRRCSG